MTDFDTSLTKSTDLVGQANRAIIKTDEDLEKSITLKGMLTKFRTTADKERLAETKPLRDDIDGINKRWNAEVINPIKKAEKHLSDVALPYLELKEQQEIERRAEAQRTLDNLALAVAEKVHNTAGDHALELRSLADQYESQGDDQVANGLRERAQAILDEAEEEAEKSLNVKQIDTKKSASHISSGYGGSGGIQRNWKYEITDYDAAIEALKKADPDHILSINEAKLGAAVRNQKGKFSLPGVRAYEDKKLRARS